jgi:PQQ-dependent dehydrogenase (methanol/ethanol family)
MYFPNPRDVIQAFDAVSGDLIWEHRRPQPEDIEKYINAPFINRNLAIHGHLIIDTSADGYLYALDARTGKEAWSTQVLDYKTGIHQTSGPIVAGGKVFSGRGCDPVPNANPDPCVIVAHDAATGRELWRTRTIPRPGEPGNDTWGDVPFEERKHVGAWMPPSYDPKLNLLYFGTSVTSPAPKFLLGGNDKKHLYHNSTLALNADTGKIVWYYQHLVDHWDLDHTFERILLDTEVTPAKDAVAWINPRIKPGQKHEVVTGIPGKTGIVYTLDRRTGEFLWARPTVYQNIVAKIDGRSGAVTINPETLFSKKGDEATVCPSIQGGKNWPAGAYSPLTGSMYFPLQNTCAHYTSITSSRREPSNYGLRSENHIAPGTQNLGTIHAISASTGKLQWKYEQRAAILSLLTTGGGLLFGGDVAGRFRAFDQRTGAVLWEINLGSQVTGFPIAYSVRGRQYLAISVGRAVATSAYALLTPEIRVSNNNSLFIFALPDHWQSERTTRASDQSPSSIAQSNVPVATGTAAPRCQRTNQPPSTPSATADGIFSAAQSAQGKKLYATEQCALCHGESMRGSAGAPALADAGFLLAWEGRPLSALFDCMKSTMPPGRAGALSDGEYMQLLAAILHANGFSPGESAELSADPEKLNRIALKRGP